MPKGSQRSAKRGAPPRSSSRSSGLDSRPAKRSLTERALDELNTRSRYELSSSDSVYVHGVIQAEREQRERAEKYGQIELARWPRTEPSPVLKDAERDLLSIYQSMRRQAQDTRAPVDTPLERYLTPNRAFDPTPWYATQRMKALGIGIGEQGSRAMRRQSAVALASYTERRRLEHPISESTRGIPRSSSCPY